MSSDINSQGMSNTRRRRMDQEDSSNLGGQTRQPFLLCGGILRALGPVRLRLSRRATAWLMMLPKRGSPSTATSRRGLVASSAKPGSIVAVVMENARFWTRAPWSKVRPVCKAGWCLLMVERVGYRAAIIGSVGSVVSHGEVVLAGRLLQHSKSSAEFLKICAARLKSSCGNRESRVEPFVFVDGGY